MISWLNTGSLLLGLAAWILAALRIFGKGASRGEPLSLWSFSACAASLCLQLFEVCCRVALGDWSALLDTVDAVARAAVFLVSVTFLLNLAAMALRSKRS